MRLLARLQHEHVLHVIGFSIASGRHYVMFDFDGYRPLRAVLNDVTEQPGLQWRIWACNAVAQALEYLHWNPYGTLLHRCISPYSVFVHLTRGQVRLADFADQNS